MGCLRDVSGMDVAASAGWWKQVEKRLGPRGVSPRLLKGIGQVWGTFAGTVNRCLDVRVKELLGQNR